MPTLRLDVAAGLPEKGEIEAAQAQRPLVEDDEPGAPGADRFREIGCAARVAVLTSRFATPVPDDPRHDPFSVAPPSDEFIRAGSTSRNTRLVARGLREKYCHNGAWRRP